MTRWRRACWCLLSWRAIAPHVFFSEFCWARALRIFVGRTQQIRRAAIAAVDCWRVEDVEAGEEDVEAGEEDVEAGEEDVEAGEEDVESAASRVFLGKNGVAPRRSPADPGHAKHAAPKHLSVFFFLCFVPYGLFGAVARDAPRRSAWPAH